MRRPSLFWLIPISGGLVFVLQPSPKNSTPVWLSSPTLIRFPSPTPTSNPFQPNIFPPSELDLSLSSRLVFLFKEGLWEPLLIVKRFMHLFALFIPVIICSPILLLGKHQKRLHGDRWGAVWWYGLLVRTMQAAGPTFIKLAQWAATRADLFPSVLCEKLGSMHSRVTPHTLQHTKQVIEKVFQQPLNHVFEEFDPTPIGTGAIAQVYRATLKKDLIPPSYLGPRRSRMLPAAAPTILHGSTLVPSASVAIKILHPHVAKTISRDLSIMAFFARVINFIPGMQWLSLPQEVGVFGSMMSQQLDLRNEAKNLLTFEHNFSNRNIPVTFPRPLQVWSTQDLLVEEHENAIPLEAFLKNGGGPFDEQIATLGLDAFLHMLLLDNFVHADLHPGNVFIKFLKPPSAWDLLKKFYGSLFRKGREDREKDSSTDVVSNKNDLESNRITSRMRSLVSSPASWAAELASLYNQRYTPEIIFIDAGLITTLDATNRKNFLDLFRSVSKFDGYRVGQLMVERSRSPELAIDTETFALKMQHLVLDVKRKTFSLGQIRISDLLMEVLKSVRQHHVKMEGDFINTVISILLLEGIGRQLDPDLDLFASALPILRQLGGQMAIRESMSGNLPQCDYGPLFKLWVWVEARSFISSALVDADELIKYDLLCSAA